MMSPESIATLADRGILALPGFFDQGPIAEARERLMDVCRRLGLESNGVWARATWPTGGLTAGKTRDVQRRLTELVRQPSARITAALSENRYAGAEPFQENGRPHLLFTLPNADAWFAPHQIWHCDAPRLASGAASGVQLFGFLDEVGPGAGGTLVVAGSHRLLNHVGPLPSARIKQGVAQWEFFQTLFDPNHSDRAALHGHSGAAGGVELEVVELCGGPGDAYLMDMRALHTVAPNASSRPRMMFTHRLVTPSTAALYES
jgi:Phytanoyl-CoA dioxygenase (PhyH)